MNGSLINNVAIADDAAIKDAILMRSFMAHLFLKVRSFCTVNEVRIFIII
jgi:hypothetical protein